MAGEDEEMEELEEGAAAGGTAKLFQLELSGAFAPRRSCFAVRCAASTRAAIWRAGYLPPVFAACEALV